MSPKQFTKLLLTRLYVVVLVHKISYLIQASCCVGDEYPRD
jgi:hypothetical protein